MSQFCVRPWLLALLFAASALSVPTAKATTTCTATAPAVAFGTVSVTGTTDVSATFTVTCSTTAFALLGNAKVRMCLNIRDGLSGGGNFTPRRMLNATSDTLQFQLYTDAARSQIWGFRGSPTVPNPVLSDFDYAVPVFVGGSQPRTFTIYGRVPTQILIAGSYTNVFSGIHTSIEYRYNESLIGPAAYPATCASGGTSGVPDTFPFTASATVPSNCRAYATTDLDFGSIPGVITSDNDQTSTIGMTCTGRTAWQVGLNNGNNASGSIRRMRLGATGSYVAYELYSNLPRTVRWGNVLNSDTVPGTGTGEAQSVTVYGRVPAAQSAAAGSYSDIITVTVTY